MIAMFYIGQNTKDISIFKEPSSDSDLATNLRERINNNEVL